MEPVTTKVILPNPQVESGSYDGLKLKPEEFDELKQIA